MATCDGLFTKKRVDVIRYQLGQLIKKRCLISGVLLSTC